MRKTALRLVIPAAILAACGGTGVSDPGGTGTLDTTGTIVDTTAPIVIDETQTAAVLADLRAEMAAFGAEVQAAASVELAQAWDDLDAELAMLAEEAQDGDLTDVDLTPAREAVDEITIAIQDDQDELSEAFQEFWADFTARFGAVIAS